MFKNYFLLTKNKNKNILSEVFASKGHTSISKQDFICIKMTHHLSILLQLMEHISTYNPHSLNFMSLISAL